MTDISLIQQPESADELIKTIFGLFMFEPADAHTLYAVKVAIREGLVDLIDRKLTVSFTAQPGEIIVKCADLL